jgi:hypothetical protein
VKGTDTVKFILALTLGTPAQGSAIAILERKPRKIPTRWDTDGADHEWIDDHALTYLERIPRTESVPQNAARVRKMLESPELTSDVDFVLDVTTYGRALMEMFYELTPMPPQYRVAIGGETDSTNPALGGWLVPEKDILAALTLHAQEGRLKVAEELSLSPTLLHALETPDATADADIRLATALAAWVGRRCQTWGPWPSSRTPPYGSPEWRELERAKMDERDEQRRRERREEMSRHSRAEGWGK